MSLVNRDPDSMMPMDDFNHMDSELSGVGVRDIGVGGGAVYALGAVMERYAG